MGIHGAHYLFRFLFRIQIEFLAKFTVREFCYLEFNKNNRGFRDGWNRIGTFAICVTIM